MSKLQYIRTDFSLSLSYKTTVMSVTQVLLLLLIGLLAGIAGGTMGIGGGIVIVPALVFIMGFTQHQAIGTSLAVLLFPIGIFAVINYHRSDYINYKYAFILIIAFLVGSYIGSVISINLPEKILKKVFGGMLLLASLKLILGK